MIKRMQLLSVYVRCFLQKIQEGTACGFKNVNLASLSVLE